jgi:predicted Co/Zn/Cd cation transporter (cation efflux family)
MFDKPHKSEPESLAELKNLSLSTRQHLHGLFEQLTEGMIILALQIILIIFLISELAHEGIKGWGLLLLVIYIFFSVFWSLRSISPIHSLLRESFLKEELKNSKTYERYCMGGWFIRTILGLLLATIILGLVIYYLGLKG